MLGVPAAPRIQGMQSNGVMGAPKMPAPTPPTAPNKQPSIWDVVKQIPGSVAPAVQGMPASFNNGVDMLTNRNLNEAPLPVSPPTQQQLQAQMTNALQQNQGLYNTLAANAGYNPATGQTAQNAADIQKQNNNLNWLNGNTDLQRQYLQNGYDINVKQAGLQNDQNNQLMGIVGREKGDYTDLLANQILGFNQGADVSRRGLTSQSTAAGALQTEGTRQGFTDISNQLANQITGATKQNDISQARLDRENVNYQTQAKMYGLNVDELKNKLNQGLQQLNLSNHLNGNDILNKIDSDNAADRATGQALMNQVMQYAGTFPTSATPPKK